MNTQEPELYEEGEFSASKAYAFPLTECSDERMPDETELINYEDM